MQKILPYTVVIVLAGVVIGVYVLLQTKQEAPQTTVPIQLFYYDSALDQGEGGAQCSRNGLVAVTRNIPKTGTPIEDAINLLLHSEISEEEKARGLTSEFPLPGVTLKAASLNDGVLTLTFEDPQNKTGGGACRAGILWFEIEATAKQFPEVQSVRFMPDELFQP